MRFYFFIHYSNTKSNSYNHIISFAQKAYNLKNTLPVIVLNTDSVLFYFRKGCLHISKRVFLSIADFLPQNSIIHFWSPRKYINEFYYITEKRFKNVLHLEDNYKYLSRCSSNKCICHNAVLSIINTFDYVTTINVNLCKLYSIKRSKCLLLRPPTIIKEFIKIRKNNNVLYLGTINKYNYKQINSFINHNLSIHRRFILVGKNFYKNIFIDSDNCDTYGFLNEDELLNVLANTLVSFVPYLEYKFDHYRYPSKVPDLLTAGIPTLLPNYDYYRDIFEHFPEFRYTIKDGSHKVNKLSELIEIAKCSTYRNRLSDFAVDYFSSSNDFESFASSI